MQTVDEVEAIYNSAIQQHKEFLALDQVNIKKIIATALGEIQRLEAVAERDYRQDNLMTGSGARMSMLWVLSGSGSYYQPFKNDRYKNYPWSEWMDRLRFDYGVKLAKQTDAFIFYNGNPEECSAVQAMLDSPDCVIDSEKVVVNDLAVDNTADQIRTFALPAGIDLRGKDIGIVSHAPHLIRFMYMLERYRPFPDDTKVRLFPVPTPAAGKSEYATLEVRGILYYSLLSPDREAVVRPFPYLV